jgi:hypothetical protein
MYETDAPFIEKWRTAMRWLDEDVRGGYPKVWGELQAMAWNHPEMRERLIAIDAEWRAIVGRAIDAAIDEYGLDRDAFPLDALVALVFTFNRGVQFEELAGITSGHAELLAWIDGWLEGLAERSTG